MEHGSGVQLLDKVIAILRAAGAEPLGLAGLTEATGIPRPTAHRLAVAMEVHGLLARDGGGRFGIGPLVAALAQSGPADPLLDASGPILGALRDSSGESTQLYRRQGDVRVCVAAADRTSGLRDSVPAGAVLPLTAGSAAQVLLAWEPGGRDPRAPDAGAWVERVLSSASFDGAALERARRQGWAESVAEREAGVASVSAPVRRSSGEVVAAISVSGPLERLGRSPGRLHARSVVAAAQALGTELERRESPA